MPDSAVIISAIRNKYSEVSVSAQGKFLYPTGRAGAEALGYDPETINSAPPKLLESFCGVGNPFSLGAIRAGSYVLDFGCGAGFDLFTVSRLIGKEGLACGVDITREMADKAGERLVAAGIKNFEVKHSDPGQIPYPDNFFDVVISNGVINLATDKLSCFREIYRVLKPGGKIQFADIVLETELAAEAASSPEAWSQ